MHVFVRKSSILLLEDRLLEISCLANSARDVITGFHVTLLHEIYTFTIIC